MPLINDRLRFQQGLVGPRITAERKYIEGPSETYRPRPISTKLLVSSIVVAQALAILAVLDATSRQPKPIYPGVIEDIRMRCAEVYAGICGMFD